jgi:hypothetical protein
MEPKMQKKRPNNDLTKLELELLSFSDDWKKWHADLYSERDSKFPQTKNHSPSEADRRAVKEWDEAYCDEHKRPVQPMAIKLDLDGCRADVSHKVDSGYYSRWNVLVLKEKNGDRYFLLPAGDMEAHGRVAIKIIKERHEHGFYCNVEQSSPPKPPDTTMEQAAGMPDKYRKMAMDEWDSYSNRLKACKEEAKNHKLLKMAIGGDLLAAVEFLRNNRAGEYEGYEVFSPEIA